MISEDVLKLGASLAAELDESDTRGRWMAHHLSDLLSRRDASADPQAADDEIAEIVLRLWGARSATPLKRQPYLRYTSIFRTLDRIDRLASGYAFGVADDDESSHVAGEFERIAHALEGFSGISSAISSGLVTELQLHAGSDEAAWVSYSHLLSDDEADEAIRRMLNRMVAASEPPEQRRENLLQLVQQLAVGLEGLRATIESAGLAPGNDDESTSPRRRPSRRKSLRPAADEENVGATVVELSARAIVTQKDDGRLTAASEDDTDSV